MKIDKSSMCSTGSVGYLSFKKKVKRVKIKVIYYYLNKMFSRYIPFPGKRIQALFDLLLSFSYITLFKIGYFLYDFYITLFKKTSYITLLILTPINVKTNQILYNLIYKSLFFTFYIILFNFDKKLYKVK